MSITDLSDADKDKICTVSIKFVVDRGGVSVAGKCHPHDVISMMRS